MADVVFTKCLQREWSAETKEWRIWVPVSDHRRVVVISYKDLCAAFPGFKEFWTPEPDDPPGDQQ